MNRTVQQITNHFTNLLPDHKQHYRPEELRSYQFPSFLVQRIIVELKRNLAESIAPPETDWANTDSETVGQAWDQYVEAIRGETYLPASYAQAVIETAVADILEMVVQPRNNIPEVIFGTEEELSYEEVCVQTKAVVVYTHFGDLLPRYMKKKKLETLTKQRCRQIIINADQKMTERYTPLNWTQMLNPLFILQQGEVDPSLLRLFFEDKNAGHLAQRFDRINEPLTRPQVIEVLSLADQPKVFDTENNTADVQPKIPEQPWHLEEENEEGDEEPAASGWYEEEDADKEKTYPSWYNEKEITEDNSLNALFVEEENSPAPEKPETITDFDKTSSAFQPEQQSSQPVEPQHDQHPEQPRNIRPEETRDAPEDKTTANWQETERYIEQEVNFIDRHEEDLIIEEDPEEDIPMWKRFFGSETDETRNTVETEGPAEDIESSGKEDINKDKEKDSPPIGKKDTGKNKDPEPFAKENGNAHQAQKRVRKNPFDPNGKNADTGMASKAPGNSSPEKSRPNKARFLNKPIFGDSGTQKPSEEEVKKLQKRLEDQRKEFVEKIFKGSERAYQQAVLEISTYNTWRDASRYIQKEIFKRNLVNIYSEQAVEFTDRLQEYFTEKQNRN